MCHVRTLPRARSEPMEGGAAPCQGRRAPSWCAAWSTKLPYLGRGWLCLVWMAQGRRDDTAMLCKAIAPHAHRFPERALEWMIANVGNAEVCACLSDADTARTIYEQRIPYAGL